MLGSEGAASGAPEEFALDTGDSLEVELPPEDNEQGLDQVQASPPEPPVTEGDGAAAAPEAEVDAVVEPVAVQEEGALSEHPLAYHPISSVLARPTILRPAVTGYPTLRIDRTGIWQLVAAEQSESAAARGALPGVEAADSVEPLEPSTNADPFQPRKSVSQRHKRSLGETRPSGSPPTISVAVATEGAVGGMPGVLTRQHFSPPAPSLRGS